MTHQGLAPPVTTICRRTGRACPATPALMAALAQADRVARAQTPALDLTGETRLDGCARPCAALFHLSPQGVALFCGVGPQADPEALRAFARGFLDAPHGRGLVPPCPAPLAFSLAEAPA